MTRIGIALGFLLLVTTGALAQDEALPDSVAQAYLAYEDAIASQNYRAAISAAATAWQAARDEEIDPELVGVLASNYARLALAFGEFDHAYDAWRSAAEISDDTNAPPLERAFRWYSASLAAFAGGESDDAYQCSLRSVRAEEAAAATIGPALSGDIHYMAAVTSAQQGRLTLLPHHARAALAAFEASGREYDFVYGNAYYLSGIGQVFRRPRAESVPDFNMAQGIFATLDGPDRQHDAELAGLWIRLVRLSLNQAELSDIDALLAASPFPPPAASPDLADSLDPAINAQPVTRVEPRYPYSATAAGLEGVIMVRFSVTERGATDNVEVIASVPPGVFDEAAVEAVSQWVYQPRLQNGMPVRQDAREVFFEFKLRG